VISIVDVPTIDAKASAGIPESPVRLAVEYSLISKGKLCENSGFANFCAPPQPKGRGYSGLDSEPASHPGGVPYGTYRSHFPLSWDLRRLTNSAAARLERRPFRRLTNPQVNQSPEQPIIRPAARSSCSAGGSGLCPAPAVFQSSRPSAAQ
jgi:hypothetical protein